MIFNASNEFDIQRAKERLGYLIEKKKTVPTVIYIDGKKIIAQSSPEK